MTTTTACFDIPGGQLHYQIAGAGAPLVFLHGFTLDHRVWAQQIAPFAAHYQVITYDLRGFGRSTVPNATPYDHCTDLLALLDHLQLDTITALIGLSLGGEIALEMALAHRSRLRSLVLVDAMIGGYQWSAAWQTMTNPIWKVARTEGIAAAKAHWIKHPGLFGPLQAQPVALAALNAMIADYSGWHWVNRDPRQLPTPPALTRLPEITVPTLIITGERDSADFLAQAALLQTEIPTAQRRTIADAGHLPNLETPAEFNQILFDFLRTVPDAPACNAS